MNTKDYFFKNHTVNFTVSELIEICHCLANEYFSESNQGRLYNAQIAWDLRDKVLRYVDFINKTN